MPYDTNQPQGRTTVPLQTRHVTVLLLLRTRSELYNNGTARNLNWSIYHVDLHKHYPPVLSPVMLLGFSAAMACQPRSCKRFLGLQLYTLHP